VAGGLFTFRKQSEGINSIQKAVSIIFLFCVILVAEVAFCATSAELTIRTVGFISKYDVNYTVTASSGTYTATNIDGQIVASGTVASTVINSVFDMMSPGQRLDLVGSFAITSTLTPAAGIYMDCTSATLAAQSSMDYLLNFAYKDVLTVDGGTWDGNGLCGTAIRSYIANQITVKNAHFENFQYGWGTTVVLLNIGQNQSVEGNTFNGNPSCWAIVMNDAGNSRILSNVINCDGDGSGIGVFCSGGSYANNEIAYNYVRDWSDMLWHAIYIGGCPNTKIHHNDVSAPNMAGGPILVKSPNTEIYNNIIGSTASWGISLYWGEGGAASENPSGSKIYNNIITDNVNGINIACRAGDVSGIEIWGNTISSAVSGSTGIMFDSGSYTLSDIMVRDNIIRYITYGVRFGSWGADTKTNNIVIGRNTFISITTPPAVISIESQNTRYTTIAYNDFSQVGTTAILSDNGYNTMVYDNIGLADKNVPANKIILPP
jgi:hypothetical protein